MSIVEASKDRDRSTASPVAGVNTQCRHCKKRTGQNYSALQSFCCAIALISLVTGCGSRSKPWEKVYAASGKVKFAGYPIAGAILTFYPKDKSVPDTVRPTAMTESDGSFEIGTYSTNDGAPAGEYDVAISWRPLVGEGTALSPGPNRLPVKYSTPEFSQLKVKVEPTEETEIPTLELTY